MFGTKYVAVKEGFRREYKLIDKFVSDEVSLYETKCFLESQYGKIVLPIVGEVPFGDLIWSQMTPEQKNELRASYQKDLVDVLERELAEIGVTSFKDWTITEKSK